MPPPPPPSKSYLLVLDTDSEDEEPNSPPSLEAMRRGSSGISSSSSRSSTFLLPKGDESINNEDDMSSSQLSFASSIDETPSIKKKQRRRKRHRKKKPPSSPVEKPKKNNHVSFNEVSIRYMERTLGGDGVPCDGGWSLGLNDNILHEEPGEDLEDFENRRRAELELRWKVLRAGHSIPSTLETRQWDYKKDRDADGQSIRNPLFLPLTEDQRHNLLVHGSKDKKADASSSLSSSPKKSNESIMRRLRSQSFDQTSDLGTYDPVLVRHVRNELEELRVQRSKDEGCSCRKLHINLPGSGKKKNRMSLQKVKDELRKRGKMPDVMPSRETLESLLHSIVQDEPCCSNKDCYCYRNKVTCQADSCSCWTHVKKDDKPTTVQEIRERCGNPIGMYVVDGKGISMFRKSMIAKATCYVIDDDDVPAT